MSLVVHETVDDVAIGLPPAPPPARPRILIAGTAFGCAAVVMVFASMLAVYVARRHAVIAEGDTWLPADVTIPLTPGNMSLVTLGISCVVIQWAVWAIARDDRVRTYCALGLMGLLGVAHIVEMAFYFTQMGITVTNSVGLLIFAIVGAQMVLTGAALVLIGLMAFRTLGGEYDGGDREGIVAAAVVWYVNVAVYAVIWYTIFITK